MLQNYILSTNRLGLRNWNTDDIVLFHQLCTDPEVMRYFPKLATLKETTALVARFKTHFKKHGYTYFAVDTLQEQEFIGFIGIAWQDWESNYTPNADIGWRLKRSAWGKGYATEGASACLKNAHKLFGLQKIIAVASVDNVNSINVMKKIGMMNKGTFNHPKLIAYPHLNPCVIYEYV